ncbi:MAG TPA: elongation factor G [Acidimicrobiales bacterium]|nr:elongation factor G [Acidimicrobiales bacterium]
MASVPSSRIRNVALVGHGGSGKTTLAEALLFGAGAIPRMGRVEDGTATTDTEPEELKRQLSASLALATVTWHDHKVNLLDCPGYADFFAEVEAALSVADLVVFVVSAVEGVEVQTEIAWRVAAERKLPRLVFVNKLDRERASFDRALGQLRATFGTGIAPLQLPIGEESSFRGVIDLLSDRAITYDGGKATEGAVPPDLATTEHEVHDALVEGIVVADDTLMERYLEGDAIGFEELEKTLARGVAEATVFPVLCGSATKSIGVDRLARAICEIGPAPTERPPLTVTAGDTVAEIPADAGGKPLAYVFKTVGDQFGRISMFKMLSGTIRTDDTLINSRSHAEERLHQLFGLRGKEHLAVDEIVAGDIAATWKLSDTATGDTLAPKGMPVVVEHTAPPAPVLHIAIRPKSKGDEDKLMTALHRLRDEDTALAVRRDDETHQTVLSGMGETHLAVVIERLKRKFGVEVETEDLQVAYRETVTKPAQAEGKYKKQTGGHGQFGVAILRVEPMGRGEGFVFEDHVVGGAIPKQFIPAVEKGVIEAMTTGGHFGYPVVDVKVSCLDGKYHPVDSSEMSFKTAGALAFREASAQAGPVLLEPISALEVTVPTALQGDVLGDLNSRRGRVQGTEQGDDGSSVVKALVPTAELSRYAIDLRSITGGRGRFTVTHDHYDPVPAPLAEKLKRETNSPSS